MSVLFERELFDQMKLQSSWSGEYDDFSVNTAWFDCSGQSRRCRRRL